MAEHELQRLIAELLRPLIAQWLVAEGRVAHAGADQFFYWVEGDNGVRRAPDVYVVDGVPQDIPAVSSWKVWEGHAPSFALEIVGDDWKKDYDEAPADYEAMGAKELVVFDPWATSRSRKRVRWQVWRRVRGRLVRVEASQGDRVQSRALGCWLRAVSDKGKPCVRLATGARGDVLVPTAEERAESAKAEAARAAAEAERAAAEAERAKAEAESAKAEAESAKVRAESAEARADSAEAETENARLRAESAEAETARLRALLAKMGG